MAADLDATDWRIVAELQRDARQSFNELSRRISMSAPAVAERVRRLEHSGVIVGYRAVVAPESVGLPLAAFVQLRCAVGRCLLKDSDHTDFPEIAEIHKLGNESCVLLRVRAASMPHLEGLLERLGRYGTTDVQIVLSTHYDQRPIEAPPTDPTRATTHAGWTREV